jgi:hypothetical protein
LRREPEEKKARTAELKRALRTAELKRALLEAAESNKH